MNSRQPNQPNGIDLTAMDPFHTHQIEGVCDNCDGFTLRGTYYVDKRGYSFLICPDCQ